MTTVEHQRLKEEIVQSANGGSESRWLLVVAIITLTLWAMAVGVRSHTQMNKALDS
nr:hypothetical protein [uncultured Desulfobulbus sp.]